ncbi:DUF1538 domain-containing protein [Dehalobacterium formicoaceticum]|uniref:DUF1538 domain-containing protein n=1 Tax=Dehalobacterium formicoaceticum TaxID=51515 RepID=UPI000B7CBD43|nr:DUF1538 domain-containing protein [Dehalobacterium formicoaceticum]
MWENLLDKFKEPAQSILPIAILVFLLHFTITPMPLSTLALFITGTFLLIIGMVLFTMGADMAIMPMGEIIGAKLVRSRKLWLLIITSFILGTLVTLAEPDLQVLAKQVPAVPDQVLVSSVALGVGFFLSLALLRILYQIPMNYFLIVAYTLVFILGSFTAPDYLAVAFDAGGVTTGPITVPFILALGMGVSSVRSGKSAEEDSFGLSGICSIGPIFTVLIMGMFYDASNVNFAFETVFSVHSVQAFFTLYGQGLILFFKEITLALLPIMIFFGFFQLIQLKLPKDQVIKIAVGIIFTLVGLTIFLTGVNIGFMPVGRYLGEAVASLTNYWILIPLSFVIGFFVVAAEPAVHVLNKQVEEITVGAISKRMMMAGLSVGVGIALTLAMIRILAGISIWYFLLPAYILALALTFFVPRIFTSIAFDSGGVAAGTMAAAFLTPFALGVSAAIGGNAMTDAFGLVAMVASTPLISIQILGFFYQKKMRRAQDILLPMADNNLDQEFLPIAAMERPSDRDLAIIEYMDESSAYESPFEINEEESRKGGEGS